MAIIVAKVFFEKFPPNIRDYFTTQCQYSSRLETAMLKCVSPDKNAEIYSLVFMKAMNLSKTCHPADFC